MEMAEFSVNRFNHDVIRKSFSAEISDLQILSGPPMEITLVSDFGNRATFIFQTNLMTQDEYEYEIYGWKYVPDRQSLANCSRLEGYSLTLFND